MYSGSCTFHYPLSTALFVHSFSLPQPFHCVSARNNVAILNLFSLSLQPHVAAFIDISYLIT